MIVQDAFVTLLLSKRFCAPSFLCFRAMRNVNELHAYSCGVPDPRHKLTLRRATQRRTLVTKFISARTSENNAKTISMLRTARITLEGLPIGLYINITYSTIEM